MAGLVPSVHDLAGRYCTWPRVSQVYVVFTDKCNDTTTGIARMMFLKKRCLCMRLLVRSGLMQLPAHTIFVFCGSPGETVQTIVDTRTHSQSAMPYTLVTRNAVHSSDPPGHMHE